MLWPVLPISSSSTTRLLLPTLTKSKAEWQPSGTPSTPNGQPIYHDLALEYAAANNRTTANADYQQSARDSLMTYLIINKANDKQFKPLKEDLETIQTRGVAKYPDTITKAMEFLHNYRENQQAPQ